MSGAVVADNVRAELARRRLTQSTLVDWLGLTDSSISRRLRGETPFRDNELVAIAAHLGVPVENLFSTVA